ncbi:urease accessory protein UreD [Gordonia crocea]|uniref:Urease accessory protein UreD n=2 Tax=Gordonia crocea TaxID=589162 RepID=A0A7I9V320_9ACTN|nr:urease accessory protein UreD [Gordonia crocea]
MSSGAGTALVPRILNRTADSARVALVPGGAMVLGGDHLDVSIDVGPGCVLEVVEVGGTVAYDADGAESSWLVNITVGEGARLLWMGRETVVSTGANLVRRTTVRLAERACALLRETTVLGRSGERGGRVWQQTTVTGPRRPVLVEELELDGAHPVPGVLHGQSVMDSVLLVGRRPSEDVGAMALAEPGALARFLGSATHDSPMGRVWSDWSGELLAGDGADRAGGRR